MVQVSLIGSVGLVIALFAWLLPFNPVGRSPLAGSQSSLATAPPNLGESPSYTTLSYSHPQRSSCQTTAYDDTGKDGSKVWSLSVENGCTLVYGGYGVNNETRGVYGAYEGPSSVTLKITDGFYVIVPSHKGQQEYCERISEAMIKGWVTTNRHPVPGWDQCP